MSRRVWGDMIRDIREERGISQRTLAVKAKVNRSTLRRIEAGIADPIDTMERVLLALGYRLVVFPMEDRN